MRIPVGLVSMLLAAPMTIVAQSPQDRAGVEQAALDYLEGFYEGDESKIRRGVHPSVTKYGFSARPGSTEYRGSPMTFQAMIDFANQVKASGDHPPETAPKEVHVLDVMNQTASAKVIAWWGIDYLHLARYDGRWQIVHVLWQTAPPNR